MIPFVNTSTRLPVDAAIQKSFFRAAKPEFLKAVLRNGHEDYLHVQFVSPDELDHEREARKADKESTSIREDDEPNESIPHMDLLGIYISHHPDFHRPVIKVSPEKVMATCMSLKLNRGGALPLDILYPTILHGVVIHELAHSLMNQDSGPNADDVPWGWLTRELDEGRKFPFSNPSVRHCCPTNIIPSIPRVVAYMHIVEESLANALVLRQRFGKEKLDVLRHFVGCQPGSYRAGLSWKGDFAELMDTAQSWAHCKSFYMKPRWSLMHSEVHVSSPLEDLALNLIAGKDISAFSFEKSFDKHILARLPAWQAEWHKNRGMWHEFLNGTFGILHTLVIFGFAHGVDSGLRLKLLRQWAANGSTEASAELRKISATPQ